MSETLPKDELPVAMPRVSPPIWVVLDGRTWLTENVCKWIIIAGTIIVLATIAAASWAICARGWPTALGAIPFALLLTAGVVSKRRRRNSGRAPLFEPLDHD